MVATRNIEIGDLFHSVRARLGPTFSLYSKVQEPKIAD